MKTRIGYVSNSSSSSFCIVGIEIHGNRFGNNDDRFRKMLLNKNYGKEDVEEMDISEILLCLYGQLFGKEYEDTFGELVFINGLNNYSGVIAGYSINSMKDDETLRQFKKRAYDKLAEFGYDGQENDIRIYIDGGYE